jgi:hypothetical protein
MKLLLVGLLVLSTGSFAQDVIHKPRPGECWSVERNEGLQALWVFSSDASALYGFPDLEIKHAGRTRPLAYVLSFCGKSTIPVRTNAWLARVDERHPAIRLTDSCTEGWGRCLIGLFAIWA